MADPTDWPSLLNSFQTKSPDGASAAQIPKATDVTAPRWTHAYWNYALGQDPWKGQWVTRYDDGRGLSRTAGIAMLDGDEGPDGKEAAWPKFNMGAYHILQALAGSGTDVTSIPSFTNAEQQLKAAIQYFDNFHIGIDQWRAKLDSPESGWKGSASSAFADVLLRLSRAFEEINTLTGGPSGSGGYLDGIARAQAGLRAAVDEMQNIYNTWGSQPTWSPAGALQQVLSGLNVDHKDNPGGGLGTTKLTLNGQDIGYVDQQGTWDLIEQKAKDLWLQTAHQYLDGMVNDVHVKLAQAYNGAVLSLKPVPTSIENAINGGGYGANPPGGTGTDDKDQPPGSDNKDQPPGSDNKDQPPGSDDKTQPPGSDGLGEGQTGNGDGKGLGDGNGLGEGQTGNGDGSGGLGEGQTGNGDGSGGLGEGQTGNGDGSALKNLLNHGSGDTGTGTGTGTGGTGDLDKQDLPPGQTDTKHDQNHYVPPYLRNLNPGNNDINRKPPNSGLNTHNRGTTGNGNKNITYKPPRPGQTDLKRWAPHDIKNYTPPPLSSGRTGTGTGTGTGSGGLQTTSSGSGSSGTNGSTGVRGPMSTASTGKSGSGVPLFPPMANGMGGKGQENQERERTTWLAEDASVWGTDPELAPTVLGRPGTGTELYADTSYPGETDEWQSAPGPYGGRPGTSGGVSRAGQGGTGEPQPGQRDGHGQGSSAQRHG
ncbi:WXG100 family type VII secretion target [Streptomyces pinistramenti]|uniref:WXG100 family type VII secretion target n=1 Tax=Streptomyces pinistramenti TaxID=2884812 RepID=UPI001D0796AA|nr:WXG100 family type VII secretion target [Streptomyces pinistramenti]MCB5909024.1 WXG100 family type VII secretion target [Streptomyces pinistramenti]